MTIHILFFCRSRWINGFMVKASSSELGDMGLIPAGYWNSLHMIAALWLFCLVLSLSVDWHLHFYIAAPFIIFLSWISFTIMCWWCFKSQHENLTSTVFDFLGVCHPGLDLKVGKMNPHLGNPYPIWAIISKNGQNFSRSGTKFDAKTVTNESWCLKAI